MGPSRSTPVLVSTHPLGAVTPAGRDFATFRSPPTWATTTTPSALDATVMLSPPVLSRNPAWIAAMSMGNGTLFQLPPPWEDDDTTNGALPASVPAVAVP